MSIVRAPRPEGNFYLLNKAISEDRRLSWAARGVLVFLLGKPDHWEVSTHHLINQTKDCLGKASGRDAVRGVIRELEVAGYLQISVARGDGGEFGGRCYTVSESPATDYPGPVPPSPANPPLVSTESKQGLKKPVSTEKPMCTEGARAYFETFWKLYPRKVNKAKAEAAWKKLHVSQELLEVILGALARQASSIDWLKSGGQYVPHPTTWLNGKRWEDEVAQSGARPSRHTGLDKIDHTAGLELDDNGNYRIAGSAQ